jgi:hypothetical protein
MVPVGSAALPEIVCDLRWDQVDFNGAVLHVRRVKNSPDPGRRAPRPAPAATREPDVALCVRQRARLPVHHGRLRPDDRARRGRRRSGDQGAPAHAAPRLRLRPRQQGPRHPGDPGLARPPVYHQHCCLHGSGAEQVQGLLAGLIDAPAVDGAGSDCCLRLRMASRSRAALSGRAGRGLSGAALFDPKPVTRLAGHPPCGKQSSERTGSPFTLLLERADRPEEGDAPRRNLCSQITPRAFETS